MKDYDAIAKLLESIIKLCDSVLGNYYLGKEPEEELTLTVKIAIKKELDAAILRKHDEAEAGGERRVRCNHCMSVYDEEYIDVDAGGPDTGETCPCCGKGDALMDMPRPAPTDEKALRGEWLNAKTNPPRDAKKQVCINRNGGAFFARYAGGDWLDDDALLRDPVLYISIPLLAREAPKEQE